MPNKCAKTEESNSQWKNSIPAKPENADILQPDIKQKHPNSAQLTLQMLSFFQILITHQYCMSKFGILSKDSPLSAIWRETPDCPHLVGQQAMCNAKNVSMLSQRKATEPPATKRVDWATVKQAIGAGTRRGAFDGVHPLKTVRLSNSSFSSDWHHQEFVKFLEFHHEFTPILLLRLPTTTGSLIGIVVVGIHLACWHCLIKFCLADKGWPTLLSCHAMP